MDTWDNSILLLAGVSFGLGALPIVGWLTRLFAHKNLQELGTGNISVSAAFYHGGTIVGVLAVISEAAKGIGVVLLARMLFPYGVYWEQAALMLLVLGRVCCGGGAGTTNLGWGYLAHDGEVAFLVILLGVGSLTIVREKRSGKWLVLGLLPLVTAVVHPYDGVRTGMAMLLSLLMAAVYSRIPDDLDLGAAEAQEESRSVFRFFQGTRSVLTLDQPLDAQRVGGKAATLALLKRSGYPVPQGWMIRAGDDPAALLAAVQPSALNPLIVRSSAVGEDGLKRSAAGQYVSIPNIRSHEQLYNAINRCLRSYHSPQARQYRQDAAALNSVEESEESASGMGVLVQHQVEGVFSGVAFSRDPLAQQGEAVLIEALPGAATQVVSGQFTPESYRVWVPSRVLTPESAWQLPQDLALLVEGTGKIPERLMEQVAYLARHLENYFHGIPQDLEWSYDGHRLWLLQCRPITNLTPIWTRKIAAEVIPGCIRPLTWSINRPLTCGVWGEIFKIVLGNDRSVDLEFKETATLHFGHAYFNATLLGQIFQRMGLPPESLEFLTRGAKFSKPPLVSTLQNIPGLMRLAAQEWRLLQDFNQDDRAIFQPLLTSLTIDPATLTPADLLDRSDRILAGLERVTYYSILAPLSFALRQNLCKVPLDSLDNQENPEVAALQALKGLAIALREKLEDDQDFPLAHPVVKDAIQDFLQEYGYLSEVGTDIAVPTWQEQPEIVENLLQQFLRDTSLSLPLLQRKQKPLNFFQKTVQQRLDLKGKVTIVYSRLLAELRACFVALEQQWIASGILQEPGDIFYLELTEIKAELQALNSTPLVTLIHDRRDRFEYYQTLEIPALVYGINPPDPARLDSPKVNPTQDFQLNRIQGIGASSGVVEGVIQQVKSFQSLPQILDTIDRQTILVVPYTDSGWAPLLAQAGGLIAAVGGQLSHGAIVAREYGIPAVMNVTDAFSLFRNGDRVRLDGGTGTIERITG